MTKTETETCLYCRADYADTFFRFKKRVCDECEKKTDKERSLTRIAMWEKAYPEGHDYTGDGHYAPAHWVYQFYRDCDWSDEQAAKVGPTLGGGCLNMEWEIFDGDLIRGIEDFKRAWAARDEQEQADHPRRWDYSIELGDEDRKVSGPYVYLFRCNTIGIPARHWEPQEGGRYTTDGVAGEYVDHPQPDWAVCEGMTLHNPTTAQIKHFVDTGEFPEPLDGQEHKYE